jgi:Putative lumazine-binding
MDEEITRQKITASALNYVESWYEGDAARTEIALHPDLAKRIVEVLPNGQGRLEHMGALELIQNTRRGSGKKVPKEKQQKAIQILDIYGNIATVKVTATGWVDYLHMAHINGAWLIVNVLWEMKPQS